MGYVRLASPRIAPGIGILVREPGAAVDTPMKSVPLEIRAASAAYRDKRMWLQRLAPPDQLGRMVLASNRSYERATILVLQPELDVKTAMVRTDESSYHYEANGKSDDGGSR